MRRLFSLTVILCCVAGSARAQQVDTAEQIGPAEQAMMAWLDSRHDDSTKLAKAVEALLDEGDQGLALLARELRKRPSGDSREDRQRKVGIDSLFSNVVLAFLGRAEATNMAYAGQFDALRVLQPQVGRFLLDLVIDTPPWFGDDRRWTVLPILRDVYHQPPAAADLDRLEAIAKNEVAEADYLRSELAYALAQWGRTELAEQRIAAIEKKAGAGETRDQLYFVRELAHLHYQCRDYPRSAVVWLRYLAGLRALDEEPGAGDLYRAACALSLGERIEEGLSAIEDCTAQVAAGDRELPDWLSRELFDDDPDLSNLRGRPRFAAAVDRAYDREGEEQPEPR